MKLDSVLTFLGLVVAISAFYFPYRASIRNDRIRRLREAEEDRRKAIEEATRPLRDRIGELQTANTQALETQAGIWGDRLADRDRDVETVTKDRDHYRDLWDNRTVSLDKADRKPSEPEHP